MGVVGGAAAVAGAVKASRGRHPLGQRLAAVLPMLRDTFKGRWAGAPKGRVIGGLAGLAYVISPLDFLPEVLLGPFGLGDDLAIAAVSVAYNVAEGVVAPLCANPPIVIGPNARRAHDAYTASNAFGTGASRVFAVIACDGARARVAVCRRATRMAPRCG